MKSRLTYITYCSADKSPEKKDIPAIERYTSDRISDVHRSARAANAPFYILSGKYGLLSPQEKIPYYDERLTLLKVDELIGKVIKQLKKNKIREIVFFIRPQHEDPDAMAYLECIGEAAQKAKCDLQVSWYEK